MSVLINGMEMPKNCLTCDCTDSEWGCCVLDPEKRCPDDYKKRAEWCPLVEIPPHGKWERHDDGIMFWWECSECHQDPWYDREELYDYCPSCGAKMERSGE